MPDRAHERFRPSANAVIAFCALLIALGGTAIAAGGSSQEVKADKKIAK
jgi:TRAP-type C4-dicarboxylate transport system permease small subunit